MGIPFGTGRKLRVERLGKVPYGPMLALQEARHAQVAAGVCDDTLFLLEHEAVVTTGKNTGAGHVLVSRSGLAARGVAFFETGRGGDVTYHGPGQIVGYPIVALQGAEQDVKAYVHRLEEVLIRTAADFGGSLLLPGAISMPPARAIAASPMRSSSTRANAGSVWL